MQPPIVPGQGEPQPEPPPQPQPYTQPQPVIIVRQANTATNTLSWIVLIALGICCGVPIFSWLVFLAFSGVGSLLTP